MLRAWLECARVLEGRRMRVIRAFMLVLSSSALAGCAHASADVPAPLARVADNARSDGAVLVRFETRHAEQWSLRRADGSFVCALPCTYWVPRASGLVVELDGPSGSTIDGTTSLAVPDELPAPPGDSLTLRVDRTHGLGLAGKVVAAPLAVVTGLMGIGFTAISVASMADGSKNTTTTVGAGVGVTDPRSGSHVEANASETTHGAAANWAGIAVGAVALSISAVCTYWFFHAREGGIEAKSPGARRAVRVGPSANGLGVTF